MQIIEAIIYRVTIEMLYSDYSRPSGVAYVGISFSQMVKSCFSHMSHLYVRGGISYILYGPILEMRKGRQQREIGMFFFQIVDIHW